MAQLNEELDQLIDLLKSGEIDKEEFERRWQERVNSQGSTTETVPDQETVGRERIRSAERMARKL